MDALQREGTPNNKRRLEQFFPARKKKHGTGLSPSKFSSALPEKTTENSPSKKGSLDGFLVSTCRVTKGSHPTVNNTNLSNRFDAAVQNAGKDSCFTQSYAQVKLVKPTGEETGRSQGTENGFKHFLEKNDCDSTFRRPEHGQSIDSLYHPIKETSGTGRECESFSGHQECNNDPMNQFAKEFLSICCSDAVFLKDSSMEASINETGPTNKISSSKTMEQGDTNRVIRCDGRKSNVNLLLQEVPVGLAKKTPEEANNLFGNDPTNALDGQSKQANSISCDQSFPLEKKVDASHREALVPFKEDNAGYSFSTPEIYKMAKRLSMSSGSKTSLTPCGFSCMKKNKQTPNACPSGKKSRSPFFSPGDAFWDEAIEVTDGLLASKMIDDKQNNVQICVDVESSLLTNHVHQAGHNGADATSDALLVEAAHEKPEIATRQDLSLQNQGVSGKDNEAKSTIFKACSPLPVRHFDFSLQENNEKATPCTLQNRKIGLQEEVNTDQNKQTMMTCYKDANSASQMLPNAHKDDVPAVENVSIERSQTMDPKEDTELSNWLPDEVCRVYRKRGLRELYSWQVECLQMEGVLNGRNLVYSASTSAGKSLVAEILMIRRVLSTGKKAMLVLPYVALCSEKAAQLESILEPIGKRVHSFFGIQGGANFHKDTAVAVCTIEKANSLINKLLEEGRISELGVVVIDELHMVGDKDRGYLLELMLTKLRYAAGEGECSPSHSPPQKDQQTRNLQIIGMSATMPNVGAVASWLKAISYETSYRPVPLEEFIKVGRTIYNKNMEVIRTLRQGADLGGKDTEHVVELCHEIVQEGHSVLLFCSSRRACETSARHVAKYLPKISVSSNNKLGYKSGEEAVEDLRKAPAGLDPVLAETLPAGVAYHHAGLTAEEREIVEACYRQGIVRVLAATSTLAAGINLPARRVIFRQPKVGRDFLDGIRYRQMAGRAGRAGIDIKGESVLICKPEEVNRMVSIVQEGCQPLQSCLAEDKNGMMRALLEVVAGGIVQTAQDVHRYVRCTLLNSTQPFEEVVKSAQDSLRWLCHMKFIEWDTSSLMYNTTPLGKAAFGSSLSPDESLVVFEDLAKARESFVLASDLHVIFEVTPIYVELEPDWGVFYQRFVELSPIDQAVGNRVGVSEPFLMRMAHGAPVMQLRSKTSKSPAHKGGQRSAKLPHVSSKLGGEPLSNDTLLRVCRRFFAALLLSKLVQESPLMEVCDSFKVPRGTVQALQDSAGRFASMVAAFCERLGWSDLGGLVSKFQNRVSFGVRAEIVELTEIPFVKAARARALYKAGLRTVQAVAEATIQELAKALYDYSSKSVQDGPRNLIQRRIQLAAARKIKNGARNIVLERAEEAQRAAFSALRALGLDVPEPLSLSHTNTGAEITDEQLEDDLQEIDIRRDESFIGNDAVHGQVKVCDEVIGAGNFSGSGTALEEMISVTVVKEAVTEVSAVTVDSGPVVVDMLDGGFEGFLQKWESVNGFAFDLHLSGEVKDPTDLVKLDGIAICWHDSPIYYLSIYPPNVSSGIYDDAHSRWKSIMMVLSKDNVKKIAWDLKGQVHALNQPGISMQSGKQSTFGVQNRDTKQLQSLPGIDLGKPVIDLKIATWLLWPDEESSHPNTLEQMVKKRLPGEVAAAANRAGRWSNQMGRVAHNGCCRRAAQIRALDSFLWKLLMSEGLHEPLLNLEMPLVSVFNEMERTKLGVNMKLCRQARELLEHKIKELELKAHKLAGKSFSLSMPADVADVLYRHLKLPVPPGCQKGKQHPSTDKQALDFLRELHPIAEVIKEHRSLSKLFHSTIGAILSRAKPSVCSNDTNFDIFHIYGHWLQTSTATGRVSMEDPNLQCVEHSIHFSIEDHVETKKLKEVYVNARECFVPTEGDWVLLSADYSQIEVRMMAHFSGDPRLIELLSKPTGDLFRMIASVWSGQKEDTVTDKLREQTKRMVYGILYGMGINALAERLECSVSEASKNYDQFKAAFPGVSSWLLQAVESCRQRGYIKTIAGRKRYLDKINNSNRGEQAKAERQAVNSICQGSAADLIKIAMINLYAAMSGKSTMISNSCISNDAMKTLPHSILQGQCRLLLQIHDELIFEVKRSIVNEASVIIRLCMEEALQLKVPLRVKIQFGDSWGTLKPLPC